MKIPEAPTVRPIETHYKGYRFRSRLEARWAVFFDALGLAWEYEPEGFELGDGLRYLPDFRVRYPECDNNGKVFQWFEVKGDLRGVTSNEWLKMYRFHQQEELHILDEAPDCRMYLTVNHCLNYRADSDEVLLPPFELDPLALAHKRTGNSLWCRKGRLWWDDHDTFYGNYDTSKIEKAVAQARQAWTGKQ
jgi:hypothetical protein